MIKPHLTTADSYRGLFAAIIVVGIWFISLFFALTRDLNILTLWQMVILMIWLTFLYTGLFITAHDAMHGIVFPLNKQVNKSMGVITVSLYALFSYGTLLKKHREHHHNPGTDKDPDFHDGQHKGFWPWYFHFFFTYVGWWQMIGMAIVFNVLNHLFAFPPLNLLLFWVIPALLSTLQLFYFGTFLPHRELEEPFKDEHRARSNSFGIILSFLTCYHFGYHWEHHAYPFIPWWKLPSLRNKGKYQ